LKLVAKTVAGLEEVLAKELEQIKATNIKPEVRAVSFEGDLETIYKANYNLRTALRILQPIHSFNARNKNHLYNNLIKFNWEKYINLNQTFAIHSTVNSPFFEHSKYTALLCKDAIADWFRNKYDKRPSVELKNPDAMFNLRINKDEVTLSLDTSGFSLHKRGYRNNNHPAPINEVLACGLILLSGWDAKTAFYDLMCGSGTFIIEAALLAKNIVPGILRKQKYAFENQQNFDGKLFEQIKNEAKENIKETSTEIYGYDINNQMIDISKMTIMDLDLQSNVKIKHVAVADAKTYDHRPSCKNGMIIINPPYGKRMLPKDIDKLYQQIGDTFKNSFKGFTAWIFSENKAALKNVGLRTSKKLTLFNGQLPCKFHKYELY